MRRLGALVLFCAAVLGVAPAAGAQEFGLNNLSITPRTETGTPEPQAGSHPHDITINLDSDTHIDPVLGEIPNGSVKDLTIELPAGVVGTPEPVPPCLTADFLDKETSCPRSSMVGMAEVSVSFRGREAPVGFPLYNLAPPPGIAARLGFVAAGVPVTVDAAINPDPPYNVVSKATNILQATRFFGAEVSLWGNPASDAHNEARGGELSDGDVQITEKPFLTLPRSCTGPLRSRFEASPWDSPLTTVNYLVDGIEMEECGKIDFEPKFAVRPTTDQASSPAGLSVNLEVDDPGLISPTGIADSDIKKAVVSLPEGVTLNPSIAAGLETCTPAQFASESVDESDPDKGCPGASNVGTVEVETPLLEGELLKGRLYAAAQYDNPFNSLIAIYMVIKHPQRGVMVKLAGKVEPDPRTGQLVTTFGEPGQEIPQFPFSDFRFRFREGGRSPLITPERCGTYTTTAVLTPWANPGNPLLETTSFEITRGVGGAACPPPGAPPFEPGFAGGTVNNSAATYSPFLMQLTRRDGDQDLVRFDAKLPQGMVAKLAGVSKCSDREIAELASKTGREELADSACPASSRVGSVQAGAGAGSQLTYVPGSIYLAGPFAGAPLSVVAVVPAVAGPFDVGVVSVRQALTLDPITAEVKVDGSKSDPIPHILAGIPLKARDIRVSVDRPEFTLNPTNCDPMEIGASIWGGGIDPFSLADDAPAERSQNFQAADCASLGFKPRISLRLKGGTKRGQFPALRAELRPRPGDANIKRTVVRLPRSAFLEQGHFGTICTRVQFAADACPAGAIYGQVEAFSPLVDEPFKGPIYLRSSSHDLPDLVFDLKGIVDIEASGHVDSHKGGIRATFPAIPDAPISRVIVTMQGGKKGLIVNSRNLCVRKSRAALELGAHNGMVHKINPVVKASDCKKKKGRRGRP